MKRSLADIAIQHLYDEMRKDVELSEGDFQRLVPDLKVLELRKKTILIEPGQTSNHMNFIHQGCLRAYYLDEQAQEHTLQVGIEGWWINDLYSYLKNTASKQFVQALETSIVVQIPRSKLELLYLEVPAFSNFFRIKIQNAYIALQERTINVMSQEAYSRYLDFISSYRDIEQRIPQYVVASYLGVTPEFLSHLRKKHAKGRS